MDRTGACRANAESVEGSVTQTTAMVPHVRDMPTAYVDPGPTITTGSTSEARLRDLAYRYGPVIPLRAAWLYNAAAEIERLRLRVKELEGALQNVQ